jgi:hypothetical protein
VARFAVREGWRRSGASDGAESRRVLEYVNAEMIRWNAGVRDDPLDPIVEAARDRIRRAPR